MIEVARRGLLSPADPIANTAIKALMLVGLTALLVAGALVGRTLLHTPTYAAVEPAQIKAIDPGAAGRLAGSLRIRTISHEKAAVVESSAFEELHAYLRGAFPLTHDALQREVVNGASLLYTWRGSDPSLQPILLAGHLDVVPVEPGTEESWEHGPFSGSIKDGFIWGRGAIDNKSAVVGYLEAVEMLLQEGFHPARTVYLAFGHDEETGGAAGAQQIAARLEGRGVSLHLVLDEGGVIGRGLFPGSEKPVALVGVAEKGFLSVELFARATGGHSSLPPAQTAIGLVSKAIAQLEREQMPARLIGPTRQLLERVGPEFPIAPRAMVANLGLTAPLVVRQLAKSPRTNAMVRTTTAATIFEAGTKDNVLPRSARAVINFRILPGDSIEDVLRHVRGVIDDDRIEIRPAGAFSAEPSSVSNTNSESYRALERAIRSVAPDSVVAPYLVVGATDARYYAGLSAHIFRFAPLRLEPADFERMHGTNERLSISNYEDAIRTYRQLIVNATGLDR